MLYVVKWNLGVLFRMLPTQVKCIMSMCFCEVNMCTCIVKIDGGYLFI